MKIITFGCVSLLASVAGAQILAGPIVNPTNGHSYYLLEQSNWTQAQAWAVGLGGNLATIRNLEEQMWVYNTFGAPSGFDQRLWIGLYDPTLTGDFVWVSGEPVVFTFWNDGEPSGTGSQGVESFVHMQVSVSSPTGQWNDFVDISTFAGFTNHGIVEIIPTPSALAVLCGAGIMVLKRRR